MSLLNTVKRIFLAIIIVVGISLGCWYAFVSLQPSERKIPQQSTEDEITQSPERVKWLKYLNSPDQKLRRHAIINLEFFVKDYDEALTILIKVLNEDPSADVRRYAATYLSDKHTGHAVKALLTALHKDPQVTRHVASALGALKDKRAVPVLLKFYNKPPFPIDQQTRNSIVTALANIPDKRALDLLATFFYQKDSIVAAQGLCAIGDKKAAEILQKQLEKKTKNSLYIKILLAGLGQEEFFPELQESITGKYDKEDDDDRVSVAITALEQLGKRGDKRAIPLLRKIIAPDFGCWEFERPNAVEALGRIDLPESSIILKDILEKSDNSESGIQIAIAWALLKKKEMSAIPVIEDMLYRSSSELDPEARLHLKKVLAEFRKLPSKDVQKD